MPHPRLPLLAAALALAGCRPPTTSVVELPPVEVPVATPVTRDVVDYEEYTGKVQAVQRVAVKARADGYLAEIKFRPGQLVKAGDVLFVVDRRPYQAALEIARGQLLQSEARAD